MQVKPQRITPLSESAVVVEFGNQISVELNSAATALADQLDAAPFPGFVEAVPAYASTTVYFDPLVVRRSLEADQPSLDRVITLVNAAITECSEKEDSKRDVVEIPADFSVSAGLDLQYLAESHSLSTDEVVSIFTTAIYRVYMIGFLPGFAYMGGVDARIQTARREQPRSNVPKGSVGIAGAQTGIYPLESPGGWQIIGRTDDEMFLRDADPPSRLRPGDRVRFVAI